MAGWAIGKSAPAFFKARTDAIQKDMEESAKIAADAEARAKAVEAKISQLSSELDRMKAEASAEMARENARLQAGTTKAIERLVSPDCLDELRTEMKRLRKEGQLHIFGHLDITEIRLVQIEAPTKPENHSFTALISIKSRDYFKDDKSGEVLRGDKKTYAYQEFWRFRRIGERWLVERIRPAGDMDRILDPKNVLSQSDLAKFAKSADPEHLKQFVAG